MYDLNLLFIMAYLMELSNLLTFDMGGWNSLIDSEELRFHGHVDPQYLQLNITLAQNTAHRLMSDQVQ